MKLVFGLMLGDSLGVGACCHDVPQEPVSRLEQFGGEPDVDPDLPEKKPKAKGKAKATAKSKAASKAKAKAKAKAKGRPRKPAVEKAQPKRKASNKAAKMDDDSVDQVEDVEVHPTTPKRRAPKSQAEQASRSKRKNENKARKSQGSGKKVSKDATDMNQPKKPRASKGQAISFGRRDPPKGERLKAEWVAIRDAYRATLNHLVPVTKHEDNSGLMVLKCFHKFPTKIHIT